MKIDLPSGRSAWLIGDPHLGKKFETGVPLNRRGDREARQMSNYIVELNTPDVDYVIMVGDLFDHPYVGFGVVCEAALAVLAAAELSPKVMFLFIAGNHDLPRNLSVVSAWDAFEHMVSGRRDNVRVIREPTLCSRLWAGVSLPSGDPLPIDLESELVLYPWQWGVSAVDQVAALPRQAPVAIGHWDLQSYGGDDSHIAPVAALAELGVTEFYSGHYHTEGNYPVGDHMVRCTGSMEPYSHSEDPDGKTYVTVTLAELADMAPEDLRERCIRVILAEGEELPVGIDCFAMTPLRQKSESADIEVISLDAFDWNKVLADALEPLETEVRTFITERLTG